MINQDLRNQLLPDEIDSHEERITILEEQRETYRYTFTSIQGQSEFIAPEDLENKNLKVFLNGVLVQRHNYQVSSNILTFFQQLENGDVVEILSEGESREVQIPEFNGENLFIDALHTKSIKDSLTEIESSIPSKTSDLDNDSGFLTSQDISSKVDKESGKGLSDENYSSSEKTKLSNIASEATKNRADTLNADKVHTHTFSQVTGLDSALAGKVDKDGVKVLSDENYTSAEKSKLAALQGSKWKGKFISLSALQSGVTTPEVGDYADVDSGVGEDIKRYIYDEDDDKWVEQSGGAADLTGAQIKTLYESEPDTNAFSDSDASKLAALPTNQTLSGMFENKVDKEAGKGLIEPAPEDGKPYARKDGAWEEVVASGGGSGFDPSEDQTITGAWTFQEPLKLHRASAPSNTKVPVLQTSTGLDILTLREISGAPGQVALNGLLPGITGASSELAFEVNFSDLKHTRSTGTFGRVIVASGPNAVNSYGEIQGGSSAARVGRVTASGEGVRISDGGPSGTFGSVSITVGNTGTGQPAILSMSSNGSTTRIVTFNATSFSGIHGGNLRMSSSGSSDFLATAITNKVSPPPSDGKLYGMRNGVWEEITDGTKIQWGTISGDVTLTDVDNGKTFLITNDAVITINDGLSAGWNVAFIPDDSKDETSHVASLAFVGSGSAIGGAATIKGVSSLALTPTANLFATAGAIE